MEGLRADIRCDSVLPALRPRKLRPLSSSTLPELLLLLWRLDQWLGIIIYTVLSYMP
jgi:hypothetical protein